MKDHTNIGITKGYEAKLNSTLLNRDIFESHIEKHLDSQELLNLALVSQASNNTVGPTISSTAFTLFKKNRILLTKRHEEAQRARLKFNFLNLLTGLGVFCTVGTFVFTCVACFLLGGMFPIVGVGIGAIFIYATVRASFEAYKVSDHLVQLGEDRGLVDADLPEDVLAQFEVKDADFTNQGERSNAGIRRQLEKNNLPTNDLEQGLLEVHDAVSMTPS